MRRAAILLPLVAVPILEIYLISRVGTAIGAGNTVLLLLAGVIAGALVIRYEGRRALRRLQNAMTENAGPHDTVAAVPGPATNRAAADAGLAIAGGVLLIIPGFISDALGLLCILPFTRPLVRRLIGGAVGSQVAKRTRFGAAVGEARRMQDQMRMHQPDGKVVQGEVITPDGAHIWQPGDNTPEPGPGRLTG
ncbi:FxsA family protein [Yinghuangia soli]|uniref:FxsA family protein n=1 Tax=Yinghuangia soli TaxID=2908204 RepID=A0AA41Q8M9_9ACTN|nr:FxsA family protein [Yinghuangia soli]MCF2532227.1 FxsA family protein [Yinghuangia soli]